jgi:uncharacterized membrane protein
LGVAACFSGAHGQTITSIGVLPGGTLSNAAGLNADGSVVVGASQSATNSSLAVRWTAPGTLQSIPLLPNSMWSQGYGISTNGQWIAGYNQNNTFPGVAIRWNASSGITQLGGYPTIAPLGDARAYGVSDNGAVVIGSYDRQLTGYLPQAFRWTSGSTINLPLPGPPVYSIATAITPDGSVSVGDYATGIAPGPFGINYWGTALIWPTPTTVQTLGYLPGGTTSYVRAVSANGQAAAGFGDVGNIQTPHAFRWTAAFGMEDMGLIAGAPAGAWSIANAISSDGSVIGGAAINENGQQVAMLSTGWAGLVDLNTYLPTLGVNTAGFTLTSVTGISADGTALCGNGAYLGQPRGWVARDLPPVCAPKIFQNSSAPAEFCAGSFGFLSVTALAPHPSINLHYQWYKKVGPTAFPVFNGPTGGGSVITGAQSPFLAFNPGNTDVAGNYFCIVTGGCTDSQSPIESVTVNSGAPVPGPSPLPLSICPPGGGGWVVTGQVPANGPYTHQWYFESPVNSNNWLPLVDGSTTLSFGVAGGIVSGANTSSFQIVAAPNMTLKAAHSTRYRCRVTNLCGSTDSPPGVLSICIGDTNCDGVVEDGDFVDFATAYNIFDCEDPNMQPGCPADMNGDGYVDDDDFVLFANAYNNFACP